MTVRLDLAPDTAPRHPALDPDEAPAEPTPAKTRKPRKAAGKPPIDTTATETPHDPVTGEVKGDALEMPDWMSDGPEPEPAPDGGF